jgi:O-antigen/teichoic acid export membrane protein
MSGIKEKFFFQLLYATSQLLFPLITYPYLTRTIGAVGLGKIAFIEYSSTLIVTVASFGIPFYGVREIAKVSHNPQKKI